MQQIGPAETGSLAHAARSRSAVRGAPEGSKKGSRKGSQKGRLCAGAMPLYCAPHLTGGVAEWSKAHAWKVCIRETVSRVRIPLPPPAIFLFKNSDLRGLCGPRLSPRICGIFLTKSRYNLLSETHTERSNMRITRCFLSGAVCAVTYQIHSSEFERSQCADKSLQRDRLTRFLAWCELP